MKIWYNQSEPQVQLQLYSGPANPRNLVGPNMVESRLLSLLKKKCKTDMKLEKSHHLIPIQTKHRNKYSISISYPPPFLSIKPNYPKGSRFLLENRNKKLNFNSTTQVPAFVNSKLNNCIFKHDLPHSVFHPVPIISNLQNPT